MTGDSDDSAKRRDSCVVAPSMNDVLRQPLPPKSVLLWLEEGLRNPQDQRIFLLCCMYFLQMRAARRGNVVQATTWTKTTSVVSGNDKSHVSYEQTKIISLNTTSKAIVDYKNKFPEGQQYWERLSSGEPELRKASRKVLKIRGRSRERKEVNMVQVQCEANINLQPEYDHVRKQDDDSDEYDCYQAMSDKKINNGKLARLRRSLVKLFKKDSSKDVDDLLSVRTNKPRVRNTSERRRTISVKREYSNVLNLEPQVSLNYLALGLCDESRNEFEESAVLYKNDHFNNYELSDVSVVRSRTVFSVLQQHHKSAATSDMEDDIREALEALEDAYLSDPGPLQSPSHATPEKSFKPLELEKSAPYRRFRDIPPPPSIEWKPPDVHTMLKK